MALKITTGTADSMLTTLATSLNSGLLRIYSGTEPATADTALSGNTLLAQLTFGATAFAAATASGADRIITANAITQDSSADADGTATFFRATNTAGTTTIYQGTVGTSGQQLNLTATNIVAGGVVSVSSLSITLPTA
jgi:hypothetical protein